MILWLVGLNIDWDCLVPHCIIGSPTPVGVPIIFQTPVTVPLHSPNGRQCLSLGLCKGTVKESKCTVSINRTYDIWGLFNWWFMIEKMEKLFSLFFHIWPSNHHQILHMLWQCHGNTAVMSCAQFCGDHNIRICMRTNWYFMEFYSNYQIKTPLMKCSLVIILCE